MDHRFLRYFAFFLISMSGLYLGFNIWVLSSGSPGPVGGGYLFGGSVGSAAFLMMAILSNTVAEVVKRHAAAIDLIQQQLAALEARVPAVNAANESTPTS